MESLIVNCVPVYINDNVSRYYEEILPYDQYEVRLPPVRFPAGGSHRVAGGARAQPSPALPPAAAAAGSSLEPPHAVSPPRFH